MTRLLGALLLLGSIAVVPRALGHADHPGASRPDTTAPGLKLVKVGTFDKPTYVTAAPGRPTTLFGTEQRGRIRVVRDGTTLREPFLDLSDLVSFKESGEPGLFSVAFAPDYARSGRLYVFYSQRDHDIRIDEFRRSRSNPDRAARSTRRRILEIEHSRYDTHFGGQLQFGPDGYLWASTGDGGGLGDPLRSGQHLGSLLGKVLRIDPLRPASGRNYSIPRDNPFVGRVGRDEIWAYGLRNPWRFSFDRLTGLWLGDVGQEKWEEINHRTRLGRGANFGWSCFEGRHRYRSCSARNHVRPVIEYSHTGVACSVTGGYVVRDPALPSLSGRYVYGDFCTGALHAVKLSNGRAVENRSLSLVVPRLTSFGKDGQGRVYAASREGGLWRLESGR